MTEEKLLGLKRRLAWLWSLTEHAGKASTIGGY